MLRALRRAADRRRQAHGDYAWLFYPYTGDELVAIDCQTTGQDPRSAELVSIAAVRLRGDRVLTSDSLDLRLRRPASLDSEALRLCGLRRVDLVDGESLDQALVRLLDFVGNRPLVGWHLDHALAILNRELRGRLGFDLPNARIDVAQEYLRQRRRSHLELGRQPRFEQVAEGLGLPVMGPHTALGNAVTTALMHLRLSRGALPVP
ncbi:3'-5' exonuclease [Halomonas cerina]|uniref:DNA polymerase-3 subunit epsilon n=1 Tax=Halomonas cerina TaxID=447424 RepID=A0A839VD79_9GAMM|nr:3'-5' exonuclease [Halomonas cerina]MBB3191339.1 DNA polymerase-3 subunit epsilon [Halomonas cerina]